jgi:O-antigen/teichoic acid export membrane protein
MNTAENKDYLVKDSFILFVASSLANLSNFVFHMYSTRTLTPEEYGILATMLAIVMLFTMPSYSLQMTIVKNTAELNAKKKFGSIEYLFKTSTLWFFMIAVAAFLLLSTGSGIVKKFFHFNDNVLIYILGGIFVVGFIQPVSRGVIQGMQKFLNLSLVWIVDAFLRLAFLVLFITMGLGVRGALATTLCSSAIAYIVSVLLLGPIFKYKDVEIQLVSKREIFGYALPVLFAFSGFSFLSYMDLFMVKHFFSEYQAGLYSATSIIGKAFLFFPLAVVMALFPKVAEHMELNRDTGKMLYKSLALTAAVSFVGIIFCYMFPKFVLWMLTGGEKYYEIAGVVKVFGLAILPLVMLNVVIYYSLAIKKYIIIYFIYAGIAVYAVLLWFFHQNFYVVLSALFGVNLVVLILSLLSLRPDRKKGDA